MISRGPAYLHSSSNNYWFYIKGIPSIKTRIAVPPLDNYWHFVSVEVAPNLHENVCGQSFHITQGEPKAYRRCTIKTRIAVPPLGNYWHFVWVEVFICNVPINLPHICFYKIESFILFPLQDCFDVSLKR